MTDKYNDMRIQNTITTVVAPIVSLFDGKDTFFNSLRTPSRNSRTELTNCRNMPCSFHRFHSAWYKLGLAGAPGIEPGPSVLETDVLAVEHYAPARLVRGEA